MTEKERRELKQWCVGQVADLARGGVGFSVMPEIVEASKTIYDWVNDGKK